MDAAIVITWSEPIPGRERQALEYATEVNDYWEGRRAAGKCSAPEMFFFSNGHGLWMVKGERDVLFGEYLAAESQRLETKGELLLQDYGCDFTKTGPAADAHMLEYAGIGRELTVV